MKPSKPAGPAAAPQARWKKNLKIALFLSAAGILIFDALRIPFIVVLNKQNGRFLAASYMMDEDNFDDPKLQLLRRREKLDQVTAGGQTQFEKIVLLRHWTHELWKPGGAFCYPPWDAVEILDLLRKYKNRGFCAQYAIVFLQACQSLGIHARYVELPGHFITAVWSDDYDRWVLMDPTYDFYYERDGLPLRGRDLCDAYWRKDIKGIYRVTWDGSKEEVKLPDLQIYSKYSIIKDADQLRHPVTIVVNNGRQRLLAHSDDPRQYPVVGRDLLAIGSPYLAWKDKIATEYFSDKPMSDDPDDFGYAFNQTMIFVARRNLEEGSVKLRLIAENAPTFATFLLEAENRPSTRTPAITLHWPLSPGVNRMKVSVVTRQGWQGRPSSIAVFYKPNFLKH